MQTKQRNSVYELIRIIATLMIIAWHYATTFSMRDGGVLATGLSLYHIFALVIGSWGQLAVDMFVIIAVHFMMRSNRFRSAKVLTIAAETVFYGIFWYAVSVYAFKLDIPLRSFAASVLTVFTGAYWYITAYLLLYIFHPVLNNIVAGISEKLLFKITALLTIFVCVFKTLYTGAPVCDFLFLVNIYFIVNCCERPKCRDWLARNAKKGFRIAFFGLLALNILIVAAGELLGSELILAHSVYLNHRGSAVILLVAVFWFYSIDGTKHMESGFINLLAGTSLGVYISHQGFAMNLWKRLLIDDSLTGVPACLHMVYSVALIYVCCAVIDLIRQYTVDKLFQLLLKAPPIRRTLGKIDAYMNANC